MSSTSKPLPLQERVSVHSNLQRFLDLSILFLLLSLLTYRLASPCDTIATVAFLCEAWFAFVWLLNVNAAWNPILFKTYPERFSKRFEEFPAVDMFVTTADPMLEPPIVTVNTVLSLLAVEYPTGRLACYVSDDGGSPLTYYALRAGCEFAKSWVPFCKKHNVRVRAPFVYFSTELQALASSDYRRDWQRVKREYLELCRKIDDASKKKHLVGDVEDEVVEFSNIERGNHPSIVKVIHENKEEGDVPHLIYVSREKRPKYPHHYKAGAMNVLTRVSGVMTNAPFILNVDCDMFANVPEVILHGMCLLFGFDDEVSSGFVQVPQEFYGALKDDPFGNQLVALQTKLGLGIGGIQGFFYGGTGCIHRRKIIYGASPESERNDELCYGNLQKIYGNSKELTEFAAKIMSKESLGFSETRDLSSRASTAKEVAACNYEINTSWGKEIGWCYGSMTEDVLTGLRIHSQGWRSAHLKTTPPGFLGNAPTSGPAALTQYKRWSTGLLEILFIRNSPILATLYKKLQFRQCLAYMVIIVWAPCGVVELCYALLPAYCFLTNTTFLPKVTSPGFRIPAALFVVLILSTLNDYRRCGLSARAWWNNQRMRRIYSSTSFLFGFLSVVSKLLGISETIFEVTRKDQSSQGEAEDADPGRFTFDSSPIFMPGTALLLVHIVALAAGAAHLVAGRERSWGFGEMVCSAWVTLSFWPFVRGLFGKGRHGIPWVIVLKAVAMGFVFVHFCGLGRN